MRKRETSIQGRKAPLFLLFPASFACVCTRCMGMGGRDRHFALHRVSEAAPFFISLSFYLPLSFFLFFLLLPLLPRSASPVSPSRPIHWNRTPCGSACTNASWAAACSMQHALPHENAWSYIFLRPPILALRTFILSLFIPITAILQAKLLSHGPCEHPNSSHSHQHYQHCQPSLCPDH